MRAGRLPAPLSTYIYPPSAFTPAEREASFPTVRMAASNFLGMSTDQIRDALTKVVSGHLRTIVAGLSVVDLYTDQARFQEDLKTKAAAELQSLGYSFLSFVFESITDDNGYLDALGVPRSSGPAATPTCAPRSSRVSKTPSPAATPCRPTTVPSSPAA